jgi:hypothetical protein
VGAMVVVLEVRNLVDQMEKGNEVTVVTTEGIVDGRGVVAGLSLGMFYPGPVKSGEYF